MKTLKPPPKRDQYAAEDHLPEWILAKAASAKEVWATSPYVTDARLFQAAKGSAARLYIDFSAMHFITGASSLEVLKSLRQNKVDIYHVACLHAKVILIDSTCFSVGSQNLTKRGRNKNLEASFISGQEASSTDVVTFFQRIHAQARRISLLDITAMEKLVAPWIAKFKVIDNAAARMDSQIKAAEQARQNAQMLARRRMRRARSQLKRFLNEAESKPHDQLMAEIRTIYHPWNSLTASGIGNCSTDSLVPCDPKQNFEALFKGLGIWPRRLNRYLVINEETGQLGFVRLGKTRWTFFADGVDFMVPISFAERTLRMSIRFDWKPAKESPRNGVVNLRAWEDQENSPVVASVDFAFTPAKIELGEIECTGANLSLAEYIVSRPNEQEAAKESLKARLLSQLTEPFTFEHNLIGREAASFFGSKSTYRVRLHHLGNMAVFSVRHSPKS